MKRRAFGARRHGPGLRHDERGITALEFALSAPFAILFMLLTIEVGFLLMADATLETAVQQASRYGITVETPSTCTGTCTRSQLIDNIIVNMMSRWTPPSSITVTKTAYAAFPANTTGTLSSTGGTAGAGAAGNIVAYSVTVKLTSLTGLFKLTGSSTYTLTRTVVVQNES
jgi:Flp pilus assembly protein TadG